MRCSQAEDSSGHLRMTPTMRSAPDGLSELGASKPPRTHADVSPADASRSLNPVLIDAKLIPQPTSATHELQGVIETDYGVAESREPTASANDEEEDQDTPRLPSFEFEPSIQNRRSGVIRTRHSESHNRADTNEELMSSVATKLRRDSLVKLLISGDEEQDESLASEQSFSLGSDWDEFADSNQSFTVSPRTRDPSREAFGGLIRSNQDAQYDSRGSANKARVQSGGGAEAKPRAVGLERLIAQCPDATRSVQDDTSATETYDTNRPYTGNLPIPKQVKKGHASGLDVVSDAGAQQQLWRKQASAPPQHSLHDDSGSDDAEELLNSFSEDASEHELQESILEACGQTRNSRGHDLGFLPEGQLYNIVNPESVARELARHLGSFHSLERIKKIANAVCSESRVERGEREKIKSFRKIFALLVMLDASSSIQLFLEEDVSDLDLPLICIRGRRRIELHRKDASGQPVPLKFLRPPLWSPFKLLDLDKYQWIMLAPFFSQGECGDVKHYLLQDQHILPFVSPNLGKDEEEEIYGGYAKVSMVRIHEDHHNFSDKQLAGRGFAVKQLYESDLTSFQKEVKILKKFSGDRSHPHIVELLATYEQSNRFHFVFYRAEGDLSWYWKEIERLQGLEYSNVLWMAKQCAGLASGLLKLHKHLTFTIRYRTTEEEGADVIVTSEKHVRFNDSLRHRVRTDSMQSNGVRIRPESPTLKIHRLLRADGETRRRLHEANNSEVIEVEQYGRHGDINPGNILWYNNDDDDDPQLLKGTLKIADFGQAELNSRLSRTKRRSVANTMTYRPPECDLDPRIVNQSYDIWCLGCVFLEFVTWMLGGEELLNSFSEKRQSYDIFHNMETDTFFQPMHNSDTQQSEVMVKEAVIQFIDVLHRNPNCTEYFHELLIMIQHNMLVIESNQRMRCDAVWMHLDRLHTKCQLDASFAAKGVPWKKHRLTATPVPRPVGFDMTQEAEQTIVQYQSRLPSHPAQSSP